VYRAFSIAKICGQLLGLLGALLQPLIDLVG
jgi:hypothetical protein